MMYEAHNGVVYNLNKFISFEVVGYTAELPDREDNLWRLVAKTENNMEVDLYAGTHPEAEAECKAAMVEVRENLSKPFMVSLHHHTISDLRKR